MSTNLYRFDVPTRVYHDRPIYITASHIYEAVRFASLALEEDDTLYKVHAYECTHIQTDILSWVEFHAIYNVAGSQLVSLNTALGFQKLVIFTPEGLPADWQDKPNHYWSRVSRRDGPAKIVPGLLLGPDVICYFITTIPWRTEERAALQFYCGDWDPTSDTPET